MRYIQSINICIITLTLKTFNATKRLIFNKRSIIIKICDTIATIVRRSIKTTIVRSRQIVCKTKTF